MANSQTFTGIDATKWVRVQAAVLAKTGISIAGDTGSAGARGIILSWNYMPQAQELDTALVKRSFFDPSADVIDADIADLVKGA